MIVGLDLRDRDRGGPVFPGRFVDAAAIGLTAADAEAAVRQAAHVVVLVHGFNVARPSGTIALTRLAHAFDGDDLVVLVVTWPGDSWGGPLGYPLEGNDADDAGAELGRTLDRVLTPGATVTFVSHSLGARVVLEAARRLDADRVTVRDLCLLAPAVDDDVLNEGTRDAATAARTRHTHVVASRRDRVLQWAYPAGDLVQSWLFAWRDRAGRALGLAGPRARPPRYPVASVRHAQIPDAQRHDHGDYVTSATPHDGHRRTEAFVRAVVREDGVPRWPESPDPT